MPTTARRVNYKQLKDILTSPDESLFTDNNWIWDGEFRFLDGESLEGNRVGFSSIPRSGNSFLRRYTEQILGITTGSAMSIHTSTTLQIMGLSGESHYDDLCWITKSHHPIALRNGEVPKEVNKTFIVVRHPLDVLPSLASLINTTTHGVKPEYSYEGDYPEWWNWYVLKFAKRLADFFEIIVRQCQKAGTPLYIVRYEDLVTDPKETLLGLMAYCFGVKDLHGTNTERRID